MNWKIKLDPIARKFGLYTSYTLDESEFLGKASKESVNLLEFVGWEAPPTMFGISLEAAKKHPETGMVHTNSLRKIVQNNPKWQYHLHVFPVNAQTVSLACHKELRPDFTQIAGETLPEMKTRLERHFRPEYGTDYFQGEAPKEVMEIVS